MDSNTCPICKNVINSRICDECGYDISEDFIKFPSIEYVNDVDIKLYFQQNIIIRRTYANTSKENNIAKEDNIENKDDNSEKKDNGFEKHKSGVIPVIIAAVSAVVAIVCVVLLLLKGSGENTPLYKNNNDVSITLEFTDGSKATWNSSSNVISLGKKKLAYVYFGSYPQSEVTGQQLTSAIKDANYDKNGIATVDGVKYKRISESDATYSTSHSAFYNWSGKSYAYFKFEPIKWRVLSSSGSQAFLLAEYGLDCQEYHEYFTGITWEKCTLRSWLNDGFLSTAFTKDERSLVKSTSVVNEKNPYYATAGGADTTDKVFLLSLDEIIETKYGFSSDTDEYDVNKRCATTQYAKAMGAWTSSSDNTKTGEYSSYWWLRSPGCDSDCAACVGSNGCVAFLGYGVLSNDSAVRPALYLNLSSIIG